MSDFDFFADQPFCIGTFVQRLVAFASLEPRLQADAPIGDHGGTLQRDRLVLMADWACRTWPGDLIETGTYGGETTALLAGVARRHGRKVRTIDCWPAGTAYDLDTVVRPAAYARLAPHADVVEILEADVRAATTRDWVSQRRYCFAFGDTMKGHEHVRAEVGMLMDYTDGLVAVDDAYCESLLRACNELALERPPWSLFRYSRLREAWLVKEAT